MTSPESNWFDTPAPPPADEVLHVDVGGYEGPLDLLLDLARRQKVDLSGISVLALAEQYLAFIDTIRERRIEVAADYLVMAAWLAYLKSRLMVPQAPGDDEPSGEMLAAMLQFRLKRLEAMRQSASRLMNRPRLGFQIYARGAPEPMEIARRSVWEASLYDLLNAYSIQRERGASTDYAPRLRTVWSLQDARDILQRLIGESREWVALDAYLIDYLAKPSERATVRASTFASSLELVRQGQIDIRQTETFGPLFMRRRREDSR
ncbi:segregation/condensation protein A [Devosia sp. XJ19-1]|uniref:Segregation and condensation protein A n=1 Tax=Devosia ureilytica TaxID=2952754 RepID=A0A9Q4ALT6_9HYPH|nr:ScpA family protein [Devosia ureilytica]MCP8882128.1 segregation/condensation protein A [Devosia ureilytica]MCP8885986.1 segregation/condensation protein A [Devosia ureilytica]